MTDVQAAGAAALADQEAAAGFLPPGGSRGLARVLPALASALGHDVHPDAAAARRDLDVPLTQRVCVVLVDGLGFGNVSERSGHAPFLRRRVDEREPLTSTFPSTTATAMGAFGTGAGPGRTAMLGYTVRNPASGQLGNLVSWAGLPPAHEWQQVPTLFEQLVAAGVAVTSVGPQRFAGSGLTEAALRGATYRAAQHLPQRVDAALDALRRPGLVYLYWGDVDKVGHHHGWGSWQWGDELETFDRELARLARGLPAGTTLLVTADHGMVDVDLSQRWDVARHAGLGEGVAVVAGSRGRCTCTCGMAPTRRVWSTGGATCSAAQAWCSRVTRPSTPGGSGPWNPGCGLSSATWWSRWPAAPPWWTRPRRHRPRSSWSGCTGRGRRWRRSSRSCWSAADARLATGWRLAGDWLATG
ncbi:alkaline phosphatase family protein [Cellulomonas soli]